MAETRLQNKARCRFFQNGPCRYGDKCKFSHEPSLKTDAEQLGRSAVSPDLKKLQDWKYGIPLDLARVRPFGVFQLKQFFKTANELVLCGNEIQQVVIERLASEGGLHRLNEMTQLLLVDVHDIAARNSLILHAFLPFCHLISLKEIRNSFAMEEHVNRLIYSLAGFNGSRSLPLFRATIEVLTASLKEAPSDLTKSNVSHLEAFLSLFNMTVKAVSSIRVNPESKELFQIVLTALDVSGFQEMFMTGRITILLEQLQRLLGVEMLDPARSASKKVLNAMKPTFRLEVDGPGALSKAGNRHDNDHEQISKISIMPTTMEIYSARAEYLPVTDARRLHLPGVEGLIDRQFRLLREDTIGQLRDAVRSELYSRQVLNTQGLPQPESQGARVNIYRNGQLLEIRPNSKFGLEIVYRFEQPKKLKEKSASDRKRWWENSKRLQHQNLVCLLNSTNSMLFAMVINLKTSKTKHNDAQPDVKHNLHTHDTYAYVGLALIEAKHHTIETLLSRLNQAQGEDLIEFPNVVLGSFQPTLMALQQMNCATIPFPDLLAPSPTSAAVVKIPSPSYAKGSGFRFDLKGITRDGSSLYLNLNEDFNISALQRQSTLDSAQAHAVVHALTNSLAIIQGPPGTGKSYVGGRLIKVLLDSQQEADLGPIICVTYTNHALDQLMEHLVASGVEQIIRIGSRSNSDLLEKLNLRKIRENVQRTKQEGQRRYKLYKAIETESERLEEILEMRHNANSVVALKNYLSEKHPKHYKQLFTSQNEAEDEDGFELVKHKRKTFHTWCQGAYADNTISSRSMRSVLELIESDLWSMSYAERHSLRQYWTKDILNDIDGRIIYATQSIIDERRQLDNFDYELDLRALTQAKVIGVTTSGLARVVDMLKKLESKVVICEEAGEVLEAHSLTTFLPSVEHAILIGDHLQLRPSTQNFDLQAENPRGKQYSFDVSLFERLVQPPDDTVAAVPFCTLETQRRMHPSIAELVKSTLYPKLQNFDTVKDYPEVAGMRDRLYWLDHLHYEDNTSGEDHPTTSHSNTWEVEMVAALVSHLVKQGKYGSTDIAVLSPYVLQVRKLKQRLSMTFEVTIGERDLEAIAAQEDAEDEPDHSLKETIAQTVHRTSLLHTVRVASIDNFQGEEAKVVIISLVRSNPARNCGFLKNKNRINVALSRAKHGMYIIGNATTAASAPMWDQVCDVLQNNNRFGTSLSLKCSRHEHTPINVSSPDDFALHAPEGGCQLKCGRRLQCGHSCPSACHSQILHDSLRCTEDCPRSLKGCDHSCPEKCGDTCPTNCLVKIDSVALPCGHVATLPCWEAQDSEHAKCPVKVPKTMALCGHTIMVSCQDHKSELVRCTARCDFNLICGHVCKRKCSVCTSINKNEGLESREHHSFCEQKCGRAYTTCRHSCQKSCHGDEPCELCQYPCEASCPHSKCSRKCSEPCVPCAEEHCDSSCSHSSCSMPCAAPCNHIPCSQRCDQMLECGHQCPSICSEKCPTSAYCQVCAVADVRNIRVDLLENEVYGNIDLDENPCIFLPCGHIFTVESLDGQMSISDHYELDGNGLPVSLRSSSEPFSSDELKLCPDCRGPLRSVRRYGRIIRGALLDESTKKFICWSNSAYLRLADKFYELEDYSTTSPGSQLITKDTFVRDLALVGSRENQIQSVYRYKPLRPLVNAHLKLRNEIAGYAKQAHTEEQPFQRVRELIKHKSRRYGIKGDSVFNIPVPQTRAYILAYGLLLKSDLAILHRVTEAYTIAPKQPGRSQLRLTLDANMKDCESLVALTVDGDQSRECITAHLLFARFAALQRAFDSNTADDTSTAEAVSDRQTQLRQAAMDHLVYAKMICNELKGPTAEFEKEITEIKTMLRGSTFYMPVTSEETREILKAMAKEFRGTGHWYLCENGHPFTVGECGRPMQTSRCPQCGAAVGGQNHTSVEGVTHARDLEAMLTDMEI